MDGGASPGRSWRRSKAPPAARFDPAPAKGPLLRLLASAGFRFALVFGFTFVAAALAFSAVLWWGTAGALDRQTDTTVRAEAIALTQRWRDGGQRMVIEAIEERLAADVENQSLYLLIAPDGRRLAGNLDRWPSAADDPGAWAYQVVLRDGTRTEARLHDIDLPGGFRLIVGRDISVKLRLRLLLAEGLALSLGVAVLFGLGGAWLLRSTLETRLRPIYTTAAAIAGGDLSHRVPRSRRQDEFDHLAGTMNNMLDQIARLMTGVRGVSDAIAHDLRTPIARTRAKLEDALRSVREEGSAEGQALRLVIETSIVDLDNITRIFQALLRITEAEAGARSAAFARIDLVPLLTDLAEFYGAAAEARGQTLETSLPPVLRLTGDRDLLLQAAANLLDNAVKFTAPGGHIRLAAQALPRGGVEISVADDGPGLSAEDRARAGERFFRADASRATPGSGLGLSLVVAVAHLHVGHLALADAAPDASPPGLEAKLTLGGT